MRPRRLGSSFRDPSGFVFEKGGCLFRHIDASFIEEFRAVESSKFFQRSVADGHIVAHAPERTEADGSLVVRPERIPFISYPYEWCFSQLKDAALLTLRLQKIGIQEGFTLKDATAYNVQFRGCKPVFIDTLSFERSVNGAPWVGYRQFCQHFLAPLALMSYRDVRMSLLLRANIDGIPIDLASHLLPLRSKSNVGLLSHIHLHAKANKRQGAVMEVGRGVSMTSQLALLDNLEGTIEKLQMPKRQSTWSNYYDDTSYSDSSIREKEAIVAELLPRAAKAGQTCWDFGGNTGRFSRIALDAGLKVIMWDFDHVAVDTAYREAKSTQADSFLPLIQDLTNPSPRLGWNLNERSSIKDRGKPDVLMALALVHHLCIGHSTPLELIAEFFSEIADHLIIEFVPPEDPQVKRMMHARSEKVHAYDRSSFEQAFGEFYRVEAQRNVGDSGRILYLFAKTE